MGENIGAPLGFEMICLTLAQSPSIGEKRMVKLFKYSTRVYRCLLVTKMCVVCTIHREVPPAEKLPLCRV